MKKIEGVDKDIILIDEKLLRAKLYTIRGLKVMLDADLAEIYGYETKAFNRQVKNNIERFPLEFRFQLEKSEFEELSRCNFCTSIQVKGVKGGRSYLPYAFTEQGVYMLMAILKGELAVKQSMALIQLFKEMKDYIIAENRQQPTCTNCAQISVLTARHSQEIAELRSDVSLLRGKTDSLKTIAQKHSESLAKVMEIFSDSSSVRHILFLNGQRFEADVAYAQIYGMAKHSIIIVDNYVGVKTLDLLRSAAPNTKIRIFSDQYGGCVLTSALIADFELNRPDIDIEIKPAGNRFHDRYIVLDFEKENEMIFHCGASSKDAGGKITTIMQIEDVKVYRDVIAELLQNF